MAISIRSHQTFFTQKSARPGSICLSPLSGGSHIQGQPATQSEFKARLGKLMRSCFKTRSERQAGDPALEAPGTTARGITTEAN